MIQSLTSLRYIAALLVFISHLFLFGYFMDLSDGPVYNFLNDLGAMGVSFFFTLSGFVLFINYFKRFKDGLRLQDFYLARVARIYPVFLITMLMAVPIELLSERKASFLSSFFSNLFLVQCYHPLTCGTLNSPGWSISSEFTFYLVFPLLLLLFFAKPLRNISLTLLLFGLYLWGTTKLFPDSFYTHNGFPLNRLAEFIAGMACGWVYLKYRDTARLTNWLANGTTPTRLRMGLTLLFLCMPLQPFVISYFPDLHSVFFLYYILPSCGLITGLAFLEHAQQAPKILQAPVLVLAGEISYSFYLLHHLVMRYTWHALRLIFHVDVHHIPLLPGLGLSCLMLTLSTVAAYALYAGVEKPARKYILQAFPSRSERTTLAASWIST